MGIATYELTLLNQLQSYWTNTLIANIGTVNDLIPTIFNGLPATGDFGANQAAISDIFNRMNTGNIADDVSFILQFPTVKAHIPCVTVEVGNEQEQEVIGSYVQENLNTDTKLWQVQKGGVFTKQYAVGVYTFSSDATLYLFSAIKSGIILLRDNLTSASNYTISARQMQIDNQRFAPDIVYFRYIDIRVEGLIDTVVEQYPQVRGISVENVPGFSGIAEVASQDGGIENK